MKRLGSWLKVTLSDAVNSIVYIDQSWLVWCYECNKYIEDDVGHLPLLAKGVQTKALKVTEISEENWCSIQ